MNLLLDLGVLLLTGFALGKVASKVHLPAITGYLIAGILVGSSGFNLLSPEMGEASGWISQIALGIIAFGIGSQFTRENLKRLGKGIFVIAVLESVGGFLLVFLAMLLLFKQSMAVSLIFGAIAAATAPAATIMVIRELRAKGAFTDTLLAVVAIDDPIGVVLFGLAASFSAILLQGASFTFYGTILKPLLEVFLALLLGLVLGFAFNLVLRKIKRKAELQVLAFGAIMLTAGVALGLNLSSLLACMALGSTVGNFGRRGELVFRALHKMETPLYVLFFTLSGASLEISLLRQVGMIGVGYFCFRIIGKALGAYVGATITEAPENVRKYLGLGFIPQGGVALGLILLVRQQLPEIGNFIATSIIATTVVYELIGPVCAKIAITRSGDAGKAEAY